LYIRAEEVAIQNLTEEKLPQKDQARSERPSSPLNLRLQNVEEERITNWPTEYNEDWLVINPAESYH
jgi:hypothetical protein